jgi:hypothetical protein
MMGGWIMDGVSAGHRDPPEASPDGAVLQDPNCARSRKVVVTVSDVFGSLPDGLQERGERFWRDVTARWELERDDIELLLEVCRSMDLAESLAAVLAAEGPMTVGSSGQPRPHPAIGALNATRSLIGRQLAQLGLPDEEGSTIASPLSAQTSRAAVARWRAHPSRATRMFGGRRGAA